jgi:hypothetical protein
MYGQISLNQNTTKNQEVEVLQKNLNQLKPEELRWDLQVTKHLKP